MAEALGDALLRALRRDRVVVILRAQRADGFPAVARTCAEQGLRAAEFTLTTPGALAAIAAYKADRPPGALIGAGTVITPTLARDAAAAGAEFLVTPATCLDVIAVAAGLGIPVIAGAFTPTEVLAAHQAGAAAVKVFPAFVTGPAYVRALRDPFPDIPLVPTGGVDASVAPEYLAAGAVALGVGSPLSGGIFVRGVPTEDGLVEVAERAGQFARAVGTVI